MNVLIFQHTPEEGPGTILEWTRARGLPTHVHHWYKNGPAPNSAEHDLLIILGGPMNVDQEGAHPWLSQEKVFLREWLSLQRPVLGICLGGQMLAQALGGRVERARMREIGFQTVNRLEASAPAFARWPASLPVYQYHEDCFTLPPGCTALASSPACDFQAYARGKKVLGLQFHPESTAEWIRLNGPSILKAEGETFVQTPAETEELVGSNLPPMTESFFHLLDDFVAGYSGA